MNLFISPHNDDESLFGAFSILRWRPVVAVVFDSFVQVERGHASATKSNRRSETRNGVKELGVSESNLYFCGVPDNGPAHNLVEVIRTMKNELEALDARIDLVIAPALEAGGHAQHNLVAGAVSKVFIGVPTTRYLTYTSAGKSRSPHLARVTPEWVAAKHRALAYYTSQLEIDNTRPHFMGDMHEYYLE